MSDGSRAACTRKTAEIAVALLLVALGAIVLYDSLRLGATWGSDAPQPGYFPFYVGLIIWGLQPGPLLFVEQKDFVWGLIASMYLGNIAALLVVLTCVPLFAAILRVPFAVIAPIIIVVCAIGAYTVNNTMFDVWMMVVFGIAGYAFKKLSYPLAPLVLALVLGHSAEASFRQAMLVSQGHLGVFFSNGLVGTMTGLALALLAWPVVSWAVARPRAKRALG